MFVTFLILVSKGTIQRKKLAKFGQSRRDAAGPISATTVVADEVQMQFLDAAKDEIQDDNVFSKMASEGKGFVRCRLCHDNHFTSKCPYKDTGITADFLITPKDLMVSTDDKKGVFYIYLKSWWKLINQEDLYVCIVL